MAVYAMKALLTEQKRKYAGSLKKQIGKKKLTKLFVSSKYQPGENLVIGVYKRRTLGYKSPKFKFE